MDELLFNQVTLAGISVWLIQKLKGSKWMPWITDASSAVNRVVAVLLAALSAAGILVTANWSGFDTGNLSIAITGLTLQNITLFAWKALGSFIFQQAGWKVLKAAKTGG